jgi:ATP-dependent RNA helicase MSS116, mitochondrial
LTWRFASTAAVQPKADLGTPSVSHDVTKDDTSSTVGVDQPRFDTLDGKVHKSTLRAIEQVFKITHMSPVQAAVLPLLPSLAEPYNPASPAPRDLLVKAKTGTGKTLGFLVPAIEARLKALDAAGKKAVQDAGLVSDRHLEDRARRTMARNEAGCLIITPTRELATQIANEALRLSSKHDAFEVRLFVGGASKRMQMRDWMRGRRDIVVGTPGRIRDLLENEPEVTKGLQNCKMVR